MRHVYLHIGRGKTGTTNIQRARDLLTDDLRRCGIHYLAAGGGRGVVGHQEFARSFVAERPDFMIPAVDPEATRKAVFEEISAARSERILLSSENFQLAAIENLAGFFAALP